MARWKFVIQGTGPCGDTRNQKDVAVMGGHFIESLSNAGHTDIESKIDDMTDLGRQSDPPIKRPSGPDDSPLSSQRHP